MIRCSRRFPACRLWAGLLALFVLLAVLPDKALSQTLPEPTPLSTEEAEQLYRDGKLLSGPYFQAPGYRGFKGWYRKPGDPAEWERRLAALPDTPRTNRDVLFAGLTPEQYSNLPCDEWLSWWFNRGSGTDAKRQAKYEAAHLHPRSDCLRLYRENVERGLLVLGMAFNVVTLPLTTPGGVGGIYGAGITSAGAAGTRAAGFEAGRQAVRAAGARSAGGETTVAGTAGSRTAVHPMSLTEELIAEANGVTLSPAQVALRERYMTGVRWVMERLGNGGVTTERFLQLVEEARRLFNLGSVFPAFLAAALAASTGDASAAEPTLTDLMLEEEMRTNNNGQGFASTYERPGARVWTEPDRRPAAASLKGQVDVSISLPPAEFVQPGATLTGRVHVTEKLTDGKGARFQPEALAAFLAALTVRMGTRVARVRDDGLFVLDAPADAGEHAVSVWSSGASADVAAPWAVGGLNVPAVSDAPGNRSLLAPAATASRDPYVVRGPLSGDGSSTRCVVGTETAPLLWQTPLAAGFDVSNTAPGPHRVELYDGDQLVARDTVAVVTMTARSDKSELLPRERASFEVDVLGLPKDASATLGYENRDPSNGHFVGHPHRFAVEIPKATTSKARTRSDGNTAEPVRVVTDRQKFEGGLPGAFQVDITLRLSDELTRPRPLATPAAAVAGRP
jgi:hypothetical protein